MNKIKKLKKRTLLLVRTNGRGLRIFHIDQLEKAKFFAKNLQSKIEVVRV